MLSRTGGKGIVNVVLQSKSLRELRKYRFTSQKQDLVSQSSKRILEALTEAILPKIWSFFEQKKTPRARFSL